MAQGKRIGVLTSGGDCPGLNAVLRGVIKSAEQLGYGIVGFERGYEGLAEPVRCRELTTKNTAGILTWGGTILGSTNKGRFGATIGVDQRVEIDPYLLGKVAETFEDQHLAGLVCIGGEGSLAIAQQFHEHGLPVVGVPKTIDNDLSSTAFTFGFDSAVGCATDALDRLHTTAASHQRVMVLEVMGRHTGWIALYSGIAGGADVILLPEIGWSFEHLCQKIEDRYTRGPKFANVVVAEGVHLPGGELVATELGSATQQARLGGVSSVISVEIERRTRRETRAVVLGHLQRGGPPSVFDRVLATQFGAHAVRLIVEGRLGEMVCYDPPEMRSVRIADAIRLSRVDPNCSAVQAARALGISFGDDPALTTGQTSVWWQPAAELPSRVPTAVVESPFSS